MVEPPDGLVQAKPRDSHELNIKSCPKDFLPVFFCRNGILNDFKNRMFGIDLTNRKIDKIHENFHEINMQLLIFRRRNE